MKMITRLFNSFDPITGIFSFNYIILIRPTLIIFSIFWLQPTRSKILIIKTLLKIITEINSILNKNNIRKSKIFTNVFLIILLINILGLFPYIFSITAHIIITLRISLPIWIRSLIFLFKKNYTKFLSHLVPRNTPLPLSQFIVLIEIIRQNIRPLTLSIRLAANITAGHVLLLLIRKNIFFFSFITIPLFCLSILETAVAIIQSYVFTILVCIYSQER